MPDPYTRNIDSAFQSASGKNYTTIRLLPVYINIQVLDFATGMPIARAPIKYLKVAGIEYIKDSKATSHYKDANKGFFKIHTEAGLVDLLKTDPNGTVRVPLPLEKFKNDIEIKVGFQHFPVVAETFSPSGDNCIYRDTPGQPANFKLSWNPQVDKKTGQADLTADPDTLSDKSWGWLLNKTASTPSTNPPAPTTGNQPATPSLSNDFKLVEKFKIPVHAPLANIHPNAYFFDQNASTHPFHYDDIKNLNNWKRSTFNAYASDIGWLAGSFSKLTHFALFALRSAGKGIDLSDANNVPTDVNSWIKIRDSGVEYVFLRTSVGVGTRDKMTAAFANAAKAAGLKIGYYHLPNPRNPHNTPLAEAQFLISLLSNLPDPDIPQVFDLEPADNHNTAIGGDPFLSSDGGPDPLQWVDHHPPPNLTTVFNQTPGTPHNKMAYYELWLHTLLSYFTIPGFKNPIVYTFPSWPNDHLPDKSVAKFSFKDYPLWIAHPPGRMTQADVDGVVAGMSWSKFKFEPLMPKPNHGGWTDWSCWQLFSKGGFDMIKVNDTDFNYFKLDEYLDHSLPCPTWRDFVTNLPAAAQAAITGNPNP